MRTMMVCLVVLGLMAVPTVLAEDLDLTEEPVVVPMDHGEESTPGVGVLAVGGMLAGAAALRRRRD